MHVPVIPLKKTDNWASLSSNEDKKNCVWIGLDIHKYVISRNKVENPEYFRKRLLASLNKTVQHYLSISIYIMMYCWLNTS